jgi:hypothetical protein
MTAAQHAYLALNEEQHRFLRQQLQQMRGSLEFYEQFVDQRRSLTAQRFVLQSKYSITFILIHL